MEKHRPRLVNLLYQALVNIKDDVPQSNPYFMGVKPVIFIIRALISLNRHMFHLSLYKVNLSNFLQWKIELVKCHGIT